MGAHSINTQGWRRWAACSILLLAGSGLCACGGRTDTASAPPPAAPAGAAQPAPTDLTALLPALEALPRPNGPGRQLSAATPFEMFDYAPLAQSGGGSITWTSGQVNMAPDNGGGLAWAVFGLLAFPTDGSVYPLSVSGESGQVWVGLSNYTTGRWEWHQQLKLNNGWLQAYTAGDSYVSPSGGTYIALVRTGSLAHMYTSMTLTASDQLFAPPLPDIQATPPLETGGQLIAKYAVTFDFSASSPGGGSLVSATFTPETGAQPVTLPDLATPFQYTYPEGGLKTATLDVVAEKNGIQESGSKQYQLTVVTPVRDLLVVYNSSIPESQDLANYYISPVTGRNIDLDYQLGLPLADSASFNQAIDRPTYASTIREPIKAFLDAPEHSALKADIKYLLLMKGVPHKITGGGEFTTDADCSSVDSELCCLYSDQDNLTGAGPGYPLKGFLINDPKGFFDFIEGKRPTAFYLAKDVTFTPHQFQVAYDPTFDQANGDETPYTLDYLVGRIDGYSFADAKAIIDRARQADTSGNGWVVFDSTTGTYGQDSDTMVDPVWPFTNAADRQCGQELLTAAGFDVWADVTTDRITSTFGATKPPAFQNSVIGYAGWGVNHSGGSYPNGANYILLDLGWNYLPGACFSSYESFNATTLTCSDPNDPTIGHPGQGQICDFLHQGGTVAVGNAWEPFTIGCADERWYFDRYLNHGDRFIEAAYKGLRLISWMEVVVGDPLCRVKP
jgi:uncharacterized protein (TIGR03790 family)